MKTIILFATIIIFLLINQIFSQETHNVVLKPSNRLHERIVPNSLIDEMAQLKSESDILKNSKSRTLINKTDQDTLFLLVEEVLKEWDGSNWKYDWRYTYTYDGNNNEIVRLHQLWDFSNWMNNEKRTRTYDGNNNIIESIVENWDGSNWVNAILIKQSFDLNNNLTEFLWQNWDGSSWANNMKMKNTWDGNHNLINQIVQWCDGFICVNSAKYDLSYIPVVGVEHFIVEVNNYNLSQNYPNPFNPSTTIQYAIKERIYVELIIYDILGREVKALVNGDQDAGQYKINLNAGGLASGIYFYRLQAGDFVETKKMVLVK